MALLQTGITPEGILVFQKNNIAERLIVPFTISTAERLTVQVWKDWCDGLVHDENINQWFSSQLNVTCRLIYMPDDSLRKVDPVYAVHENDITSFSDGYPLMLLSQASLDDLNERLEEPLPMDRFRPNIVITGASAYEEDEMEDFVVGDIRFSGVKLCARCAIPTINQQTLAKSKEPLKTLATYRTIENNIWFGQNVLYDRPGEISVGDEVSVVSRKAKLTFQNS